jgi:pimeloyl-ACP methyl ester carboxylesterase
MTRTIYGLLVGIDQYASPDINPLYGCVNDIMMIETFLKERVIEEDYRFDSIVLTNEGATYQAIIDGFRTHLRKAGEDDVALFYYSGHGSQEQAPPEFWHLEPDRLDETIVCYDSRTQDHYDLADKELAKLIAEVAERSPHIVIILDCCHSGTATRDDALGQGIIRRAVVDRRQRPMDSFHVFTLPELKMLSDASGATESTSNWITLPRGKHILMAACRDYETAKELLIEGKQQGIFSYTLLDTLRQSGRSLTYRDLYKRTEALIKNRVQNQVPQIEASKGGDLNQPFLGGAIVMREYFTLSYSKDRGWVIDAGAVHGISLATDNESTTFAIFQVDSTAKQLRELESSLGQASIIDVQPQLSVVSVELKDNRQLDQMQTYKVVVTSTPLTRPGVLIEGEPQGVEQVITALTRASFQQQSSLYISRVDTVAEAKLRVLARNGTYSITRPTGERRLVADIEGYEEDQARKVVSRLEHISRWTTIAELANGASRLSGAVQMEIHHITGPARVRTPNSEETEPYPDDSELRLEYRYKNGRWERPEYKIKLINTGKETVYCALAYLSEEFAVDTSSWFSGGRIRLGPGEEAWAAQGKRIPSKVPDELWSQGITEYRDLYKLIVSTEEFDATLLEQEDLDFPLAPTSLSRGVPQNTLNRLLHKARTRKPDLAEQRDMYADWTTSQICMTIVRPLDALPVPKSDEPPAFLGSGISIEPHKDLQARVRLTTIPQAGRDLRGNVQPPLLWDNSEDTYLFQFSNSRGSDPGLSALELLDVQDYTVVTPEEPLIFNIDTSGSRDIQVARNEHVLPYGYDGEFFLPLGRVTRTQKGFLVELRCLPKPVPPQNLIDPELGDRSITGSIRIFFQKVVSQRFGLEDKYPLLRAAKVSEDGTVQYEENLEVIRAKVADSRRIILYIHGIIGDTRIMAASARYLDFATSNQQSPFNNHFDLILTFDYENLNTPLKETAVQLKECLEAVGLGVDHSKMLHIVAHSMGGLVARWFIEREGGKKVVQHLVMLGTPNKGSPWSEVEALGTVLIFNGLNLLSKVVWQVTVLAELMRLIEKIDVTLDEMRPISSFLDELWQSDDPHLPYTIIAGNTSLFPGMQTEEEKSRFKRMMVRLQRLFSKETWYYLTGLAFFDYPNDIAVSVVSAQHVPMNRSPKPELQQIACDHVTYFSTEEGLNALAKAVE